MANDAETAAEQCMPPVNNHYLHWPSFSVADWITSQWPVQDRTRAAFEWAATTHNVSPLPAFDEFHSPIAPTDYQTKLCGVVVQVHLGLKHYLIKQEKKSVFTAVAREIVVLHPPVAAPVNPLKRRHLSDGPSTSQLFPFSKIPKVSMIATVGGVPSLSLHSSDLRREPNLSCSKTKLINHTVYKM